MDTIAAAHDAMAFSAQEKTALLVALGANEEPARTNPDGILQSAIQISAAGARAAFGSAAAADTVSQLEEPSPDIEPLTSLGDALYALGDVPGAADAYARAVEAFIGEDEPVERDRAAGGSGVASGEPARLELQPGRMRCGTAPGRSLVAAGAALLRCLAWCGRCSMRRRVVRRRRRLTRRRWRSGGWRRSSA